MSTLLDPLTQYYDQNNVVQSTSFICNKTNMAIGISRDDSFYTGRHVATQVSTLSSWAAYSV